RPRRTPRARWRSDRLLGGNDQPFGCSRLDPPLSLPSRPTSPMNNALRRGEAGELAVGEEVVGAIGVLGHQRRVGWALIDGVDDVGVERGCILREEWRVVGPLLLTYEDDGVGDSGALHLTDAVA